MTPSVAAGVAGSVPAYRRYDFAGRRSRYGILVPVLDEGERIRAQLRRMAVLRHGMDVFVADGGSTDGSVTSDFLAAQGVRTLLVKTGPGRLSAQLRMGFAAMLADGYQGVVTVDGNGKDGVAVLDAFAAALDLGYDFVQGSRFAPGGAAVNTPAARYWGIRLIHAPVLSLAAGHRYTDTTNGFRAHSARLLRDPRVAPFRNVFDSYELLAYLPIRAARLGYRIGELPVRRAYPARGPVPTKIRTVSANLDLLRILLNAVLGRYNPEQPGTPSALPRP